MVGEEKMTCSAVGSSLCGDTKPDPNAAVDAGPGDSSRSNASAHVPPEVGSNIGTSNPVARAISDARVLRGATCFSLTWPRCAAITAGSACALGRRVASTSAMLLTGGGAALVRGSPLGWSEPRGKLSRAGSLGSRVG